MHSKGICQYQQFFTINKKTVFSQRRQLVHKFLDKRKIPAVLSLLGTNGALEGVARKKLVAAWRIVQLAPSIIAVCV